MAQITQFAMLAILAFNLVIIILLAFFYLRLAKLDSFSRGAVRIDRKFRSRIEKVIEKQSSEAVSKLVASYSRTLEGQLGGLFSNLESVTTKQSVDLANFIKDQQAAIIKETQLLVANDVVKMQKELEDYRLSQIKNLDSRVNQVIADVAKRVLAKSIDMNTHQELVIASLEKAKAENLFGDGSKQG